MLEIRVGGVEMVGGARSSRENGFIVKPDGFQGWRGLPAGRREALARAVQHGEHDVPTYLPSRVVTIDGWVVADSEYELENLSDRLAGVGAPGERLKLTVDARGKVSWAWARRLLVEVDDSPGGSLEAEFQAQFVCADPRKYGETRVYPRSGPGTVAYVSHEGTFPAFPVVEIPDAPSDYTFVSPGGRFTVTGAVAGQTHRVDMRTGRVFRVTTEMPGVGSGELWAVPPGEEWQHTLSVPGLVKIPDTFI